MGSRYNAIVSSIYEAALDPSRWQEVLKQVGRYVGARRAVVGYSDITSELANVFEMRRVEELVTSEIWVSDYDMYDPWSHTGATLDAGDVRTGCQLLPVEEFRSQPVYNDVFIKADIEDCLVGFTARKGECISYISLYRSRKEELFGKTAVKRLSRLMPHLVRSAKIHAKMTDLKCLNSAHQQVLDCLPVASVLCDQKGQILVFNNLAEELFKKNDGVIARQGYLRASQFSDDEILKAAILSAGLTALCQSDSGGKVLAIQRRSRHHPLNLIISPVSEHQGAKHFLPGVTEPSVIVFINDPYQISSPQPEAISSLLGITPAESALVLAVCSGQSLSEFADQNSKSIHTVQAQMKSALRKTDTHRQSDLVRLVMNCLAGWG